MCGRYYIDTKASEELRRIIQAIEDKIKAFNEAEKLNSLKKGEIYPTSQAPILVNQDNQIVPELMTWGYSSREKHHPLINARSETAQEKPTFRVSLSTKRCLIPCNGFFEWDRQNKQKYYFKDDQSDILYMAGLFRREEDGDHFVVLTTQANISMEEIHHRMPVIITPDSIDLWMTKEQEAIKLLSSTPPVLERTAVEKAQAPYEQLSLWD